MEEQEKMVFCENHVDVAAIDNCAFCGKAICYRCRKRLFGITFCGFWCAVRLAVQSTNQTVKKWFRKPAKKKKREAVVFLKKRLWIIADVLLFVGLLFSFFWIGKLRKELKVIQGGEERERVIVPADTSTQLVQSKFQPTKGGMVTANTLDISGEADVDRIVSLSIDGKLARVMLPQDGKFLFEKVRLHRGANRLEVRALTQEGQVSILQILMISYGMPTFEYLARDFQRGPVDRKEMAFTFDGGSSDNVSSAILDILKKNGVKATFFLTGEFIEKYPKIVKRIVAEGHDVGNHTWSHPHLTSFAGDGKQITSSGITAEKLRSELLKTAALYRSVTGKDMVPLWRAPYGEYNSEILRWAAEVGFRHVGWTVGKGWAESMDTMDWVADKSLKAYHTADEIADKILAYAKRGSYGANGAVILMHLGSERKDDFPHEKLSEIIEGLKKQGYVPVKVAELMAKAEPAAAGAVQKGEKEPTTESAPIPR
jgi:peptidoglycan/xylan/chitin deacetylase (PgdA/CDA1 family)